jgi:hypothetical protein
MYVEVRNANVTYVKWGGLQVEILLEGSSWLYFPLPVTVHIQNHEKAHPCLHFLFRNIRRHGARS